MLGDVGWEPPTADVAWCTTEKDAYKADMFFNDEITLRTDANVGLKVLGTMITFDNAFDVELENRLARATTFWSSWELLGCVSIPLPKRSQVF